MPNEQVRPSSIQGIKRLAKRIASEKSVKHTTALDEAARAAGYQTFLHAKRSLSVAKAPAPLPIARKQPPMNANEFKTLSRSRWANSIDELAATGEETLVWTDIPDIVRALAPFMGKGKNHGLFPTNGGFDFLSARRSREANCIEFEVNTGFGQSTVVARPRRLILERIASDPAQSFFILELDELQPSVFEDDEHAEQVRDRREEHVLDLGDAHYVERGSVDYDDLSDDARNVIRLLSGKLMFVAKGSHWNGISMTYSGLHDTGTHSEVRKVIQEISDRMSAH